MAATNEFSPCHYQSLSVTPIDKYIGRQIKLRRNYLKMSQDKLGQSVNFPTNSEIRKRLKPHQCQPPVANQPRPAGQHFIFF